MKHTKGPWSVSASYGDYDDVYSNYQLKVFVRQDEEEANARLMEAAPDMLEALKIASKALHNHQFTEDGEYNNEDVIEACDTINELIEKVEKGVK